MSQIELIATTAFGLEAVVARELRNLGYDRQTITDGRVIFWGDELAIVRANLWLRCAERVLVKMGSFEARDFGTLFEATNALAWPDWIPEDGAFPVRGRSVRSQLHSVPHCQALVKKAIVERLKQSYGRSWFDETGPVYSVEVSILKDQVTLALDTTGAGLHKRGYRKLTGQAPLKETLAAALVQLSYWNCDRAFLDPFCGTGTIPVEAALIARNMAPGLNRSFAADRWQRVPQRLWDEERERARSAIRPGPEAPLIGTDRDVHALRLARHSARCAGVEQDIHFQQQEFDRLSTKRRYGCLICNPPYGERLGDAQQIERLYRSMGPVLTRLDTWSHYVLTSHSQFEKLVGRRADRRRKLYNGRIPCTFFQFFGPPPPRRSIDDAPVQSGQWS